MPHAFEAERDAATERLHETVTAQARAKAREWEQVSARQATAVKARAEAAATQPAIDVAADQPDSVVLPAPRPAATIPEPEADDVDQELVLEELTHEQVLDWRTRAAKRLSGLGHLDLGYTPWGQA